MRKIRTIYKNKYKLVAVCIEAVSGIFGGAVILTKEHPYIALAILSVGAVSHKFVQFMDDTNINQ